VAVPGEVGFETLFDTGRIAETAAERLYGAPLRFPKRPRPYIVSNFVSTIDGAVSLGITDGTDSSTISSHALADRYVMALLRAAADVVVIGAGTLRASVGHQWVPKILVPEYEDVLRAFRESLGRAPGTAPLAVVTGSGQLPSHVALTEPATRVVVVTSPAGATKVRDAFPALQVITAGESERISGADVAGALHRELRAGVVLCEGGPTLLGSLVAAHAVHELFLTVSPLLSGRDGSHPRPALLEGVAFEPSALLAATLLSVRRAQNHLLLRYRLQR
jgi:riboflavin biosynthesis pyrimidine reductase